MPQTEKRERENSVFLDSWTTGMLFFFNSIAKIVSIASSLGSSYSVFIPLTCSSWQTVRKLMNSWRIIDLFSLKLACTSLVDI